LTTPQGEGEASRVLGEAAAGLVSFTKSALMLATIVATTVTALLGAERRWAMDAQFFKELKSVRFDFD
jgi:hypothetical protein